MSRYFKVCPVRVSGDRGLRLKTAVLALTSAFLMVVLIEQPVSAAVQTLTCPGVSAVIASNTIISDINTTISCPQFDPSLGTLSQIGLTFSAEYNTATAQAMNTSGVSQTGILTATSTMQVGTPPGFLFGFSDPFLTSSFDAPAVLDGFGTLTANGGGTGQHSEDIPLTTGFAPYEGLGTFGIPFSTSTMVNISGNTFIDWTFTWSADGGATVEYTYEPCTANCGGGGGTAPEPAMLALLGVGLAGLGFARRRRLN